MATGAFVQGANASGAVGIGSQVEWGGQKVICDAVLGFCWDRLSVSALCVAGLRKD